MTNTKYAHRVAVSIASGTIIGAALGEMLLHGFNPHLVDACVYAFVAYRMRGWL